MILFLYKLAKQAGDYTNVREQRGLDPRQPSNFMQNNLFKKIFQPTLQGQQLEDMKMRRTKI